MPNAKQLEQVGISTTKQMVYTSMNSIFLVEVEKSTCEVFYFYQFAQFKRDASSFTHIYYFIFVKNSWYVLKNHME